jgi:tetrapyrrole methylase family protein/MazG family protein
MAALTDPAGVVIVRTLHHPAAAELAASRAVTTCDDLYDSLDDLDAVYAAIAGRVLEVAGSHSVVYAVPGSASVGERAAALIVTGANERGIPVDVLPGESFVDLALLAVGVDPLAKGLQILDGRSLPDPLPLHVPTLISQVDTQLALAEVATSLGKVLDGETPVVFLDSLGGPNERIERIPLRRLDELVPGPRTSLFVDPPPVGWFGLVAVNRALRLECPWDRDQTHHSLLEHLLEEAYEAIEAIGRLGSDAPAGEVDYGAYAEVEEELGDLLLQVVFHATLAREAAAFDVEEVAEGIRRKLVHRHPHVFGDVVAHDAETVRSNWETLKSQEKRRDSLMDDVPRVLPALARAAKLQRRASTAGFDWSDTEPVVAKIHEEVDELDVAAGSASTSHELGDVLFSVVNLARHLDIDPEGALRSANERFEGRFRSVEASAVAGGRSLEALSLEEMDELWEAAKLAPGT